MLREISAGGVVVRRAGEEWLIAVIEPQHEASADPKKTQRKTLLALPKGLVDPGESSEQAALREVLEETGLRATVVAKLTDSKYVYVRTWGDKKRVFKIVSFYLLHYQAGNIGEISPEMRIEVKRALWLPLPDALHQLSYPGERDAAHRASEYLLAHPEIHTLFQQ